MQYHVLEIHATLPKTNIAPENGWLEYVLVWAWPIFRGKLAVVYWGVYIIHHETQLWKVHSLAEHAAFSCEGTTSFFIVPGMCFGEIHEIHEIQGERWMRVDAATHACWLI